MPEFACIVTSRFMRSGIFCGPILAVASLAAQAADPQIRLIGDPELYLSHLDMTCAGPAEGSELDVTDVPVSAFRRKDGSVVVVAGNQNNFFLEGRSVDSAKRVSCSSLVEPVNDSKPEDFNARRWLFSLYATSYDLVLGFVHNEYHGEDFFPDTCKVSTPFKSECWYASTTLVASHDGGFTFETPKPPDNVIASMPWKFATNKLRAGAMSPKVVGNPKDGMVYVMIDYLDINRGMRAKQCLLRGSGKSFSDWRAWDGKGFNLDMESPYAVKRRGDCTPVIPYVVSNVKYVPKLDRFVSLGLMGKRLVYSFSADLITWSKPQVLKTINPKQTWSSGKPAESYQSLLDPDSSSINFDTLEKRPYLYYVRYGTDPQNFRRQRDIYRQRIEIQ